MNTDQRAGNALARALAQRQQAAARWRRLALEAGPGDAGLAEKLSRVTASEQQHAERLAREVPMIDGEELTGIVGAVPAGPSSDCGCCGNGVAAKAAGADAGVLPAARVARAIEDALQHERRLRAAFEQLATRSPDDAVRVRALALALAETRHLRVLEEVLGAMRCKL